MSDILVFLEGAIIGGRMRVLAAARELRATRVAAAARGEDLRMLAREASTALAELVEADIELEEHQACAAVARALEDGL